MKTEWIQISKETDFDNTIWGYFIDGIRVATYRVNTSTDEHIIDTYTIYIMKQYTEEIAMTATILDVETARKIVEKYAKGWE